jgi:hypothetical protein
MSITSWKLGQERVQYLERENLSNRLRINSNSKFDQVRKRIGADPADQRGARWQKSGPIHSIRSIRVPIGDSWRINSNSAGDNHHP